MAETVLVTGASRGIGRATALELHERGWEIVATARDPRTIADLPVTARVALDVTDAAAVRSVAQEWPGVDAVVNNAGIGAAGPVESTPVEVAREIFELNVHGVLRTVAAFAPAMRARGSGAFVTVSSVVARIATPLAGVYASSKWALEGLSEAMRLELSHFGVRVTLIEPGEGGERAVPVVGREVGHERLERSGRHDPRIAATERVVHAERRRPCCRGRPRAKRSPAACPGGRGGDATARRSRGDGRRDLRQRGQVRLHPGRLVTTLGFADELADADYGGPVRAVGTTVCSAALATSTPAWKVRSAPLSHASV